MIYLEPTLQQQVFRVFHYSLKPTSFLLLGTSESVGELSNLFALVDKKSKLYSRKQAPTRPNLDLVTSNNLVTNVNPDDPRLAPTWSDLDPEKEADRIVLNQYAPSGVLTNNEMDILQFRGDTSPYFRPAPGKASLNLLKMARASLLPELRSAMHQARQQDTSVIKSGLRVEESAPPREVSVEVIPFKASPAGARYFLVLFKETSPALGLAAREAHSGKARLGNTLQADSESEIVRLQQELAATQEYLQATIQEQEATNQELRVANEEILSSNEELQSTNEELETAQEEIQATNEELNTTNEELRSRILESNRVNSDLRNLLGSVNIPIVMLGNDLSIRRFTPMAEKIFNLIPSDVGRPLNHIKPNINVPNLEQLILDVIDTLVVKEQEVQDTEGRWYNMLIRPYKTIENQIDGAVMVLVDIDAIKRSTEQIKASRDYAEAIVETIPEPLVVLDANLRVNTANRCFYQTFQVSRTQTEHNTIFELGNGQWNIPQLRSLLEEVLPKNNQIDNFEVEHVFEKIGRKTMLLNACKILRTDNKEMILLVIQDITEQKLFEEQRNQLLTTEQSARSVAEVANLTKDEFLSIVSHELRNPLNSMLGWTQLLRNRKFDAAQTERALSMIEKSAKSQAKLIEDILDISRITTGKLQLNVSAIALAPVIEAAINVARPSAEAKNIQIEAVIQAETIEVSGDPDRLQQVIWNLLSNAIKFTPAGGQVTVKLSRKGEIALLQVSDTGIGISLDFLPYVFERFRQADSSKTRVQGGLGLGLSIVYQLVELHGGTVRAESPGEGQGTTMTVQLPLQALPTDRFLPGDLEQVESTTGLLVPLDSIQPLEGLRVLVVDDEAGILELLKTIVEQYGAEVTAVGSAKEAIAVLQANPGQHDVLLSDIGMPHEDGYALIRQVRALSAETGGQIPAAALTAHVRAEEERESLAAGFQRHIAKPVEPAQLVSIIADLAGRN